MSSQLIQVSQLINRLENTNNLLQSGSTINIPSLNINLLVTGQIGGITGGTGTYTIRTAGTYSAGQYTGYYMTVNTSQLVQNQSITINSTYSVDYGDGTTNTITPSTYFYTYNYSTYAGSVLSLGYKAAVMNLTTISGQLQTFSLYNKPIATPVPYNNAFTNGYNMKFLDISIGSPYLSSVRLASLQNGTTGSIKLNWLQQFQIISSISTYNDLSYLFATLTNLQSIPTMNVGTQFTTMVNTFDVPATVTPMLPFVAAAMFDVPAETGNPDVAAVTPVN